MKQKQLVWELDDLIREIDEIRLLRTEQKIDAIWERLFGLGVQ